MSLKIAYSLQGVGKRTQTGNHILFLLVLELDHGRRDSHSIEIILFCRQLNRRTFSVMKSRILSQSSMVTSTRRYPITSSSSTTTTTTLNTETMKEQPLLVSVDFEVWGDTYGESRLTSLNTSISYVDTIGTYFLKYARDMCKKLGLSGWIRLSRRSTVIGTVQGEKGKVDEMALWLKLQGSPGSRIDHTDFSNWQILDDGLDYKSFSMRF